MPTSSRGSTIARNSIFLLISRITMLFSSLLLFAFAGRRMSISDFGIFTLALAYSRIFYVAADFGAGYLNVREIARAPLKAHNILVSGLIVKILPVIIGLIILFIITNIFYEDSITIIAIILGATAATLQATGNFFRSFFNAHERMLVPSILLSGESLFFLGATTALLLANFGVVSIMIASNLIYFVSTIISGYLVIAQFKLFPRWDFEFTKLYTRQSFPFISFLAFGILYSQLDSILLSLLAPTKEIAVGIYQASFRLITSLDYLPDMLTRAAYPAISKAYQNAKARAVQLSETLLRYLVIICFPMTTGIFILAEPIIIFIYSEKLIQSAIVMKILALVIPFRYMSFVYGITLSATDNQKFRAITTGIVFVINSLLNLIVIPKYGYIGAASINLISMATIFVLYWRFSDKYFASLNIQGVLKGVLLSSVLMGICLWFLLQLELHLFILVILGGISYAVALHLTKTISKEDYAYLSKLVQQMLPSK